MCGTGLKERVASGVSTRANCSRVTRSVSTWDMSVAFCMDVSFLVCGLSENAEGWVGNELFSG